MSILNSTMKSTGPYLTGTVGTAGTYTISSGSNGILWQDLNASSTSTITSSVSVPLHVKGNAEIDGNLKVGGKDLMNTLAKIEERLNILTVDPELETRWDELQELGDRYRELEAHILSKERLVRDLMRDYHND
jgi:hypothetical protein